MLRILPARMAMESAKGREGSLVKMTPFLTIKSAANFDEGNKDFNQSTILSANNSAGIRDRIHEMERAE